MTSQLQMEISYRVDERLILKQNSSHFDAHRFIDFRFYALLYLQINLVENEFKKNAAFLGSLSIDYHSQITVFL